MPRGFRKGLANVEAAKWLAIPERLPFDRLTISDKHAAYEGGRCAGK